MRLKAPLACMLDTVDNGFSRRQTLLHLLLARRSQRGLIYDFTFLSLKCTASNIFNYTLGPVMPTTWWYQVSATSVYSHDPHASETLINRRSNSSTSLDQLLVDASISNSGYQNSANTSETAYKPHSIHPDAALPTRQPMCVTKDNTTTRSKRPSQEPPFLPRPRSRPERPSRTT
jgi:hypothetical protein